MKRHYAISLVLFAALGAACDTLVAPDDGQLEPAAALVPSGASAVAAAGTSTQTGLTSLDVKLSGPNTTLLQTSTGLLSGTLSGEFEDQLRVVIHPTGRFMGKFTSRCVCTVEGRQGVIEIHAEDTGELLSPDLARFAGRAVITGGTGELAGLRGVLKIEGTVDVPSGLATYTYSGTIRLHP